jgi:DNA repair protein SbcD/Mre11
MTQPFRFIHAADFHLERPLRGLAEVPDHLRVPIIDAPYRAAERVFDAAIKERVDFVVLAGDIVDPLASGPRGLVFLGEQFQRLAGQGVRIYWAGGRSDDFERWIDAWPLGDNVLRFPPNRVERIVHTRGQEPLAQILGSSTRQRKRIRAADFRADGSLFSIAVAYGTTDAESLAQTAVNYWALGGEHDRRSLLSGPIAAHYCGTPQGRRPGEWGARGCILVHVDETQRVRTSFLATDAVRFLHERVSLGETATREQFEQILNERVAELAGDPFGPDLVIQWTIAGSSTLASELRRGRLTADLTSRLRAAYGAKRPSAWTVAIETEPSAGLSEDLYDEDTVLGEFLRTVQHYVDQPEAEINLEAFLAERHLAGSLGADVAIAEPAVRKRLLAEVARLGVELLSPQELRS